MRLAAGIARHSGRHVSRYRWVVAIVAAAFIPLHSALAADERPKPIDLTAARLVTPSDLTPTERKAVEMLLDEVHKRTLIRWQETHEWPTAGDTAVVAVGPRKSVAAFTGPYANAFAAPESAAEGYAIRTEQNSAAPAVLVVGNDSRGVLFGIGKLLRTMSMSHGKIVLDAPLNLQTAPQYRIRGHQLGYRPKTNSYDAWDLAQWEQYIRDLAVFGCNSVELIPPRSDDDDLSPHFPLPKIDMMAGMSQILDDYGLDVWIWFPALDRDYSQPETVQFALDEWGAVFRRLPRVDAIFVPTGDPGHTPPRDLMPMLKRQTEQLRQIHPGAETWISLQSFTQQLLDEMAAYLESEKPDWLAGVVYGPQTRVSLEKLRQVLPKQYSIRRYPDITHSLRCEYPVPDWDRAYAFTEAREVINPRPVDEAIIFRAHDQVSDGVITYSEGCNDDVNKIVWSGLSWDRDANVVEVLRDYARYFIGSQYAGDFADGLLALEQNWRGPLLSNESVAVTLEQFQQLERTASPELLGNWRFQQALYRAYYDAYQHERLIYETSLENQAMDALRDARRSGSLAAIERAQAILSQAVTNPVAGDLRARVFQLAEALFQSIRMQLSVELYQAIDVGRGANLDTVDVPINNRLWLETKFNEIRALEMEPARLRAIDEIVNWTNPGPGGFYDDLGNPAAQPHLVRTMPYDKDPGFLEHETAAFHYQRNWRLSWCTHVDGLYETIVSMHYPRVDPSARYKLRVLYAGDNLRAKVKLTAGDGTEIHPLMAKPTPVQPTEFEIPASATADGTLTLNWTGEPGRGGPGRGCQIAEVWLIKKAD